VKQAIDLYAEEEPYPIKGIERLAILDFLFGFNG
jgi:hypothetical protein